MCNAVVMEDPWLLIYVPDWFVMQELIKICYDGNDYCNYDEVIGWYDGYEKWKAQKAQIEKELLRVGWHLSRWWD